RGGPAALGASAPFPQPPPLAAPIQPPAADWARPPPRGGLDLYFFSSRAGSMSADTYRASRPSLTAEFGAAERVVELDTAVEDTASTLTDDALDIIFTRMGDLYEATRSTPETTFDAVTALAINSATADGGPFLSADGRRLVF